MRPSFFHHLHPPTIPERQSRFRYTLGAGGISLFLLLVVIVTGILEMFYYVPTAEGAPLSIQTITFLVPYGGLVRNLHYWAAQFLVVATTVHLLRVVLTGSYRPPRRFNYLLGLGLLVLVLFLNFSGYVLRWDEGIRWALVAGTNLVRSIPWAGEALYRFVVGGQQPGNATVLRFYAWHIFGLTLLAVILGVWHIFRVRRDGGIAVPPPLERQSRERISRGELVRREVLAALVTGIVLILVSIFVPAPLSAPMEAAASAGSDSRAPWFFLWVQNLLRLGDPFWLGVAIPLALLTLLVLIPYAFPRPRPEELGAWWPRGGRLAQVVVLLMAAAILLLTIQATLTF